MSQQLWFEATQSQYTPAGRLVHHLYYGAVLDRMLADGEYSGYPHNGGEHSLSLHLSIADFKAFLDLVAERYATHPGLADFLESCKTKAIRRYPQHAALLH